MRATYCVLNIDNILTLTNDTPLPEIETNTGCCLVHKLTKLIWTGKHLADDGGTDGGCHSNDGRTCIYYNIYVSNCFSVSRMLLANHIASTRTSQLSTLLEVHVVPLQQLLKLIMMRNLLIPQGCERSTPLSMVKRHRFGTKLWRMQPMRVSRWCIWHILLLLI